MPASFSLATRRSRAVNKLPHLRRILAAWRDFDARVCILASRAHFARKFDLAKGVDIYDAIDAAVQEELFCITSTVEGFQWPLTA
jgi:hypothetical protein